MGELVDKLIEDHAKARRDFTKLAESVQQWDGQSPCSEWDGRGVVEHVIGFHEMLFLKPLGVKADRPRDDPVARWKATDAALDQALTDASLDQEVNGPMGETTPRKLLLALTADVLMHTWDLARAAGLDIELDPDLSASALAMGQKNAAMLEKSGMFGTPVAVPDDAPVQDRMLGQFGRDPAWTRPD
ncbi:MAG: TIGR03086 family protein [Actinobacteria bacterium]|nr:TIGR03086 family protein [Actinomycetota bacterium]